MSKQLCIEWREIGKEHWNYSTGTCGLSRGMLRRLISGWRARNPAFEFRISSFERVAEARGVSL